MKFNNYMDFREEFINLADEGRYKEALTFLQEGIATLPKKEQEKYQFEIMDYKRWCLYKNGMYDEVFKTFTDMIEKGFICPLHYCRSLKNDPRYIALKEKNDLLLAEKQRKTKFEYVVYVPQSYTNEKKYPLFFNLHGDEDSLEFHRQCWKPEWLLNKGFIVVYLQSSQVTYHNAYVWIRRERHLDENYVFPSDGKCEIYSDLHIEFKNCYDSISKQYSINEKEIVIGGFSGGAVAAIDIALSNIIPIRGAVPLCSSIPKMFNEENVKAAHENGLKFVFMEGEKDVPVQDVEEMMKECKRLGIPYEYYINKGVGHAYPDNLDEQLEKALNFILR